MFSSRPLNNAIRILIRHVVHRLYVALMTNTKLVGPIFWLKETPCIVVKVVAMVVGVLSYEKKTLIWCRYPSLKPTISLIKYY
jgi:hypothetical protein